MRVASITPDWIRASFDMINEHLTHKTYLTYKMKYANEIAN